jgi:superfamily I DNA/RNA helicase
MAKEAWYINESELDDFQVQVIRKRLDSSFLVKGCAGSGKTVLALWRAKELAEKGEQSYLVVVFTKALRQFIEDGISEIGVDAAKVMYHWHWKNRMGMPQADYIILDETQDFTGPELQELRGAARKHLIAFGDSAQQVYKDMKQGLLTMEQMQVMLGIPLENLVINHRLPKKIARLAEYVGGNNDLESRCRKEGANKPRSVRCRSLAEQCDYIHKVVSAQGYKDVGILLPHNEQCREVYDTFKQKGHEVEVKYDDKANFRNSLMNLNFRTSTPKILTYHSAKGLQFEAVFLPMCNVDQENNRNALYVALTRSYRDLYILHNGDLSPFLRNAGDRIEDVTTPNSPARSSVNEPDDADDLPF